jgi:hypothetical protein
MTEALKLQNEDPENDDINEDAPNSSVSLAACAKPSPGPE